MQVRTSDPGSRVLTLLLILLSVTPGAPLSGQSEAVRGLVFGVLRAADLPTSAALTHTPQHAHLHQPAQHGHEVHILRPEVHKLTAVSHSL